MTVKYSITPGQKLTEEEKEEIRNAKKMEPQFDEDCPELSETMLKSLKAAVRNRNRAMSVKRHNILIFPKFPNLPVFPSVS